MNRQILTTATSIAGSTLITSSLGYAYWAVAARLFEPSVVGLAAGALSAVHLLGLLAMMGLGTVIMRDLSAHAGTRGSLILTSATVAAGVGAISGWAFAAAAARSGSQLAEVASNASDVFLVSISVAIMAAAFVIDQGMVGILRGELQLFRNIVFAISKLGLLVLIPLVTTQNSSQLLIATWPVGICISFVSLSSLMARNGAWPENLRVRLELLRGRGGEALRHHALNLVLQAPPLVLPVMVVALVSAAANAHFYIAWMIASTITMVSTSLTTALYAVSSHSASSLRYRFRFTLASALGVSALAAFLLFLGGKHILAIFGESYADGGYVCLQFLAVSALVGVIREHYATARRIEGEFLGSSTLVALGGVLRVSLALMGAAVGELNGLGLGWLVGSVIECLIFAPTVARAVTQPQAGVSQVRQ